MSTTLREDLTTISRVVLETPFLAPVAFDATQDPCERASSSVSVLLTPGAYSHS